MRVCLFFDGKNHMKDLRRSSADKWVDHGALAEWAMSTVGGTHLVAAYYYTGVGGAKDADRHSLTDLLAELEGRPGFFIKRFERRPATRSCPHCSEAISYTEEKQVDTSLVADMVSLAARDAFDIAVVFSGDLDIAPGLAAIHAFGKQGWIATFGEGGLARGLRKAAWGTLDLAGNLDEFAYPDLADTQLTVPVPVQSNPASWDAEMLRELRRAEAHFGAGGGFVGAHYFIHRWKGHGIPETPDDRRQSVQRLLTTGLAETYSVDGKTALRVATDVDAEEETIEMGRLQQLQASAEST